MPSTKPKRVRVERGLYKRGKTYHACATPEGSKTAVWKSLGEVNLSHARRLRDEFVAEVRGGRIVSGKLRFAEVAQEWIEQQRSLVALGELRQSTYEGYESALRLHVRPQFDGRVLQTVKPDDLVRYQQQLPAQGIGDSSVWTYYRTLRLVLVYALRKGYIASNPADALTRRERPKPGARRVRYLETGEINALLRAADERYRMALELGIFCGLRQGEVRAVRWEDVALSDRDR